MIRRFENTFASLTREYRIHNGRLETRRGGAWERSAYSTMARAVNDLLSDPNWKETIVMNYDSNDLTAVCNCFAFYGATSHKEGCLYAPNQSPKSKDCTCGSAKCGSDRHSDYCDLYEKR